MAFSLCLILACGSISFIVFILTRQSSQDNFYALAVSQLERVEEHIKTFIEPGAMSVRHLADMELIRNSRGKLTSYLDTTETTTLFYANHPKYEKMIYDEFIRTHNSNRNYGLVFMANEDGQYAQAPEGHIKMAGYDPRLRSWYKEAMEDNNKITVTSPYLTTGGGVVCSIMVKTYDPLGRPLGLLGVDYSLETLIQDLDSRSILQTGYLVIFDANGRIITDGHHPEYVSMQPEEYPDLRKQIAVCTADTVSGFGTRGIHEYVVVRRMEDTGWKIAVIFDERELLLESYRMMKMILPASVVVLLIALAASLFLAKSIVRPIEELIEASTIISGGEYEHSEEARKKLNDKLSVTGQGESRKLAESLRLTLNALQERVEDAKQGARAKSDFLSNMSHEIRTPLNAVIGMTKIAKDKPDAASKNYCLDKIDNASKHLLGVINDILDMSKIEANKLELSDISFDFGKMLQNVEDISIFKIKEKNQRFTAHIDDSIPRVLVGDDQRLAQVITNLLSNAVKFTPDGGSISVSARLLREVYGLAAIQIEVADTGIGLTEEQRTRLFHSFSQAESSTSRKFGGTGLGLAISKSIVELMGGDIWVESEPGKGSVFIFTIQMKIGAESALAGDSPERGEHEELVPDSLKGYRMLFAEDIEINREILVTLLEPTGIEVDCAENGAEAIEMYSAAADRYDIIFMDVQMPEMDGYEATRRIRASEAPDAGTIPIIAMTANVFREDIEKCLEVGMNDHLAKPLDIDKVLQKLREYLPPLTS
jgi:signal transduction histidine kinase/ActR/RegA family two-component response regulator